MNDAGALWRSIGTSAGVDNFELFPIELRNPQNNKSWTGYSLFNVIGLLDAADLGSSVGDVLFENEHGPDWMEFEELILFKERTLGMNMFRLANSPEILLVHGRIRQAMLDCVPEGGWGMTSIEVESR